MRSPPYRTITSVSAGGARSEKRKVRHAYASDNPDTRVETAVTADQQTPYQHTGPTETGRQSVLNRPA
jgi:hypothetical protein